MLSNLRKVLFSRVGTIVTLGILLVIALAFAAGDITGLRSSGQKAMLGGSVAEVGSVKIGEAELRQRVQTAFAGYRKQQPTLDMASFVAQGGFEATLERMINAIALDQFARSTGMAISKRMVDGEIASIPAFQGFDGKFDQKMYDSVLAQQRVTDKDLRTDIARETISRHLLAPTLAAHQVSEQLALPYASLLLERRKGAIGVIPIEAFGTGTPPSDQELTTFYTRQRARYTVPERRTIRYAVVDAATVAVGASPTAAEIAAAYAQDKARFAPSQRRTVTQVVVLDQASAAALAQKVKAGTALDAAARTLGLEPRTFADADKATIAGGSSAGVADAIFAAASGAVVGPVKSPLGWHVARVDAVRAVPGKTLAEATPELTTELAKNKGAQALADLHDKLDDSLSENATFDELVADAKLKAEQSAPVLADGTDPLAPAAKPLPIMAPLAQAAFGAEPGDAPQLVQTNADGSFAVVAVGRVIPAAPRPLAEIRAIVAQDFIRDRNLQAARRAATEAVAKASRGASLAQALAGSGLKLPAPKPVDATRAEVAAQRGQVPPPIALMFSMAPRTVKMLEAPNGAGYFVVALDAIQNGDARGNAALLAQTRQGLGGAVGNEYVQQFAAAVKKSIKVRTDLAAVARVRRELAGGSAASAE